MKLDDYLIYAKDGSVSVTTTMHIHVPTSYEKYRMLKIQDTVRTLAIFDIYVDKNTTPISMLLPAIVEMGPSEVTKETVDGTEYAVLIFKKGDMFVRTTKLVRTEYIAYVLFTEFIENARVPKHMSYNQQAFIFDAVVAVTGSKVRAEHAIYEVFFAHLARDAKNIRTPYRHTPMTSPPLHLKLKDVPHVATSTTTKLMGSYLKDSLTSAVVNEADSNSDIEDMMRQ